VAPGQAKLDHAEAGYGRGGLPQYDLFLMNDKAGDAIPPLRIAIGERIRAHESWWIFPEHRGWIRQSRCSTDGSLRGPGIQCPTAHCVHRAGQSGISRRRSQNRVH
jgi:hypothetical protein